MPSLTKKKTLSLKVGARVSDLSKAQTREVLSELQSCHKDLDVRFECCYMSTTGDLDLEASLTHMDKTDFFTKEIDQALLNGSIDIGIHSAKDLPDPLHEDLEIISLTKGKDSRDALLMSEGKDIGDLKKNAVIACSSLKRQEEIKKLRHDFTFTDVRGCVKSRIEQLNEKKFDALVVAEAAIIRLELTHLNRYMLSYPTTKFQGQLAILAKKELIM
ncbi:Hydroxymethylbilane synthase, partial [Chlamydiales bacterium SCGC AB-751-O23]